MTSPRLPHLLLLTLALFSCLVVGHSQSQACGYLQSPSSTSKPPQPSSTSAASTMSTRFPTPQNLSDEQKSVIEEAVRVINTTYDGKVQIRDSAGNLLGPFAALIYTPRTFLLYLNHITTAVTTPLLTPRERELATLVTASVTNSDFVVYAHKKVALTLGITEDQVDDAVDGEIPEGLSEREVLVTQLALKFARTFGNVRDESWARGEKVLGNEAMSALVQYVAGYLHASTLVNAANIPVPDS